MNMRSNDEALEAPIGTAHIMKTPWGEIEAVRVVEMKHIDGSIERYAGVNKPKSRPWIRYSSFKIKDDLI